MFRNVEDMVAQATEAKVSIGKLTLAKEAKRQSLTEGAVYQRMLEQVQVMRQAVARGLEGIRSHSSMTGGDALKLKTYLERGTSLTGDGLLTAVSYAIANNEVNAAMGLICAAPTAGASGVLPGVLLSLCDRHKLDEHALVMSMFTAGAFGYVIANNAVVSGAQGGCQAEIGVASAMAAAGAVELFGGSPQQAAEAAAMALKGMLGLACDPLAGLVEVPCIKRNAAGAANALAAAEMALAGVESQVPCDEVIEAMHQIGLCLSPALRETAQGGLAATPTGQKWKDLLWTAPEPAPSKNEEK